MRLVVYSVKIERNDAKVNVMTGLGSVGLGVQF